jgi:hypothetical protein
VPAAAIGESRPLPGHPGYVCTRSALYRSLPGGLVRPLAHKHGRYSARRESGEWRAYRRTTVESMIEAAWAAPSPQQGA